MKLEPEGRALACDTVEADPAAVRLDDFPAESKPQPGAADLAGVGRVDAVELREQHSLLVNRNPQACVGDRDTDSSAPRLCNDRDRPAGRRVLDRVRDEVGDDLCDPASLSEQG